MTFMWKKTHTQTNSISRSVVWRGRWRGTVVAIKSMRDGLLETTAGLRDEFTREVEVMESIRCPYIVSLYGAVLTRTKAALVLEFLPLGSLGRVQREYEFSDRMRLRLASDVVSGMVFLHSSDILHRDLKSENVLCLDFSLTAPIVAKISDFGNARTIAAKTEMTLTRGLGTPVFMAPEVMSGSPLYDKPADVFSFSILFAELLTSREPYSEFAFRNPFALTQAVLAGKRPTLPADCDREIAVLVQHCWAPIPEARPSFVEVAATLAQLTAKFTLLEESSGKPPQPPATKKEPPMAFSCTDSQLSCSGASFPGSTTP